MRIGKHNTDENVFFIAEVGNNHEGSFDFAAELVGLAAEAGADAIKFQTFQAVHFCSPETPERVARLKTFELRYEQFAKLAKLASEAGIQFLSTPLDMDSAHFLNDHVPAFKVASSDNTFFPLLDFMCSTGKPIILSSGLCNLAEIAKSVDYVLARQKDPSAGLAVLHCVSQYPVDPPESANVGAIHALETLPVTVGYSDHVPGIAASLFAVAEGARIVEKHFTLRHDYSEFRDHQLSANPAQLKELVSISRDAAELAKWLKANPDARRYYGSGKKEPSQAERDSVPALRRSIAARRDLKTGEKITEADIGWTRPAGGFSPGDESKVIGRTLVRPVVQGHRIMPDDLESK